MSRSLRRALPALAALTLLANAAPALATSFAPVAGPSPTVQPAPQTTQGIIMRDGGVCDPIRHMGC